VTPPARGGSPPPHTPPAPLAGLARGALVAGLVPGQLLGWSWPDRLRHALALAAGGAGPWTRTPGGHEDRDHVDLPAYERLLDAVQVEPAFGPGQIGDGQPGQGPRPGRIFGLSCTAWMPTIPRNPTS
jgi:hypothetical protein